MGRSSSSSGSPEDDPGGWTRNWPYLVGTPMHRTDDGRQDREQDVKKGNKMSRRGQAILRVLRRSRRYDVPSLVRLSQTHIRWHDHCRPPEKHPLSFCSRKPYAGRMMDGIFSSPPSLNLAWLLDHPPLHAHVSRYLLTHSHTNTNT